MAATPKQELRAVCRAERRAIAAARDLVADDLALAGHLAPLLAELEIGPGDWVTAYEQLPTEPPMTATIAAIAATGARAIVPITLPSYDLDWSLADDPSREPLGVDVVSRCRLLVIPGLAADGAGNRLGQAGGCYDRVLPRKRDDAVVVLALHPGELRDEPIPTDPWDQPVDAVLTADGLTWLTPRRPQRTSQA